MPFGFGVQCVIWGSTWGAIKVGLKGFPPFLFASARQVLAAAILLFVLWLRGTSLPRRARDYAVLGLIGLTMNGLPFAAIFWGEQHVASGLTAVVTSTSPLWTALLAHLFIPGDRLTLRRVSGVALGLFGLTFLFQVQLGSDPLAPLATLVLVGVPISWGVSSVLGKRLGVRVEPLTIAALQIVFSLLVLIPLALVFDRGRAIAVTPASAAALAYLVLVGSSLGFFLYYWLLKRLRPSTLSLISLVTPVEAVLIGLLLLGEPLTLRTVLGLLLVSSGLLLTLFGRRAAAIPAAHPELAAGAADA